MKYFQDHLNTVKPQTFDMAIITDSKGKAKGKIIVRYTNSQIGYNNETGIVFHHQDIDINFSTTIKGDTYNKGAVFTLLTEQGCKVLDWSKTPFYTYSTKNKQGRNIDGISSCTDQKYIKVGNSLFTINWV